MGKVKFIEKNICPTTNIINNNLDQLNNFSWCKDCPGKEFNCTDNKYISSRQCGIACGMSNEDMDKEYDAMRCKKNKFSPSYHECLDCSYMTGSVYDLFQGKMVCL